MDYTNGFYNGTPGMGGGGPNPSTYTAPSNTPQGIQNQAGMNQNLVAAANSNIQSGQTLGPQEMAGLQQLYGTYSAENTRLSTPQARAEAVGNTNLDAMQANYSDLASKLANYDNIVLKPEFQGSNPGLPTDLPANPDVYFGNLSYITPGNANLPANQGIYNANPGYALNAQAC